MIVQTDFLNRLRDFGLNSYEAKLWAALLSRGISTAGELSDIANVPRSRSYDVLESLEKKGFIIIKIGKPIKYIAVPPEEVIERVKKKITNDANKQMILKKAKEYFEQKNWTKIKAAYRAKIETDIKAEVKKKNNNQTLKSNI